MTDRDGVLAGKVAMVTGSGRGIGLAIAQALTAAGARVYAHDRRVEDRQALTAPLRDRFLAADLAADEEIRGLANAFAAHEPRLDVLVNNAAVQMPQPLTVLSVEDLERTWRVNARAAVELTQYLLPQLGAASTASVINVTSIHETVPYAGNLAYCMAKAALSMFSRVAALELAPLGIRVNSLAPGAIETETNRDVLDAVGRERFKEWIPAGRTGHVEEVAAAALYLASPASSYVTGSTLTVDGGYSQHLVRYRLGH
ncbi:MAG: SDR family oxidoreductase [Luteitalea sp.]|nr:SDR family oxidoreductase [Luteitalea sp.]